MPQFVSPVCTTSSTGNLSSCLGESSLGELRPFDFFLTYASFALAFMWCIGKVAVAFLFQVFLYSVRLCIGSCMTLILSPSSSSSSGQGATKPIMGRGNVFLGYWLPRLSIPCNLCNSEIFACNWWIGIVDLCFAASGFPSKLNIESLIKLISVFIVLGLPLAPKYYLSLWSWDLSFGKVLILVLV